MGIKREDGHDRIEDGKVMNRRVRWERKADFFGRFSVLRNSVRSSMTHEERHTEV